MKTTFIPMGVCVCLIISACTSSVDKNNTLEQFPVTYPKISDTVYTNEYVADIHSRQNVELRSRVKGYIEKIHIDEGEYVKQGQLLYSIGNKGFQQDLLKSRAALSVALAEAKAEEVSFQNTAILFGKNVIAKSELAMAESKMDAANARVEEAKAEEANALLNLSYTRILAPFDGVINRMPNKRGSLIEEGTLLTTLSDNKEVFAYFRVSEKEYLNFILKRNSRKTNEIELVLANNEVYKYKGIIETVESEIDKRTGNIAFRARFPNPELVLKHGASGKVRLKAMLKNAMIIPQKSTFEIQEKTFVFVVDKDNVVKMRSIVPTLRLPNFYVVETGLSPDEMILFEGIQRVKEGDKIIPVVNHK